MKALVDMIREGGCGLSFWGGHLEIVNEGRLSEALRRHSRNDYLEAFRVSLASYGFRATIGSAPYSFDAPAGVKDVDHILLLRWRAVL